LRALLQAWLLELTLPLKVSPRALIVMWEAIVTVLVASAVLRANANASAGADAAIAATLKVL
jgi:hypothetical protein